MKAWLRDATYISCIAASNELTINQRRRAGKQDAWSADAADPVEIVPLSGPEQVGSALRRMLAIRLPPAR